MPTPQEILRQLAEITNEQRLVAMGWHVMMAIVAIVAIALGLGWRPSRRQAALGLAGPCVSVAILAAVHGNPFNAAVFTALAAFLALAGLRLEAGRVVRGAAWTAWVGGATLTFGLVYPHFLEVSGWLEHLLAAPFGVIPCPTLAVTIGLLLVADGLGSRIVALVRAVAGVLCALFGALRLGVSIDLVLLVGSFALLARALLPARGSLS